MLDNNLKKIDDYRVKIIEYYCEDALTFDLGEFLKIFNDFCSNVNRAIEVHS